MCPWMLISTFSSFFFVQCQQWRRGSWGQSSKYCNFKCLVSSSVRCVVVFLTCLPSHVLSVSPFQSTSTHTHTLVSLKPALCEVRLKCLVCVRLGEGTCAVMCSFCIVAYKVIIYQMKNLCLFWRLDLWYKEKFVSLEIVYFGRDMLLSHRWV